MRTGLLARKVGSSRLFTDDGGHVPVTLLVVEGCQVVGHRTHDKDGYDALQLGAGNAKVSRVGKPMRGHYAKAGVAPKRKLSEFRISADAFVGVGEELTADHFLPGQHVDVSGTTIGKGFAGVMKRHHFHGLRATHGVSVSHRSHGSTGQRQDPGRVFKGKKMAGHLGAVRVTTQNLEVMAVDPEQGLIIVRGAVPGGAGGWVRVTDAVKTAAPEGLPFPAGTRSSGDAARNAAAEAGDAAASEDSAETAAGEAGEAV